MRGVKRVRFRYVPLSEAVVPDRAGMFVPESVGHGFSDSFVFRKWGCPVRGRFSCEPIVPGWQCKYAVPGCRFQKITKNLYTLFYFGLSKADICPRKQQAEACVV